MPPNPNPTHPSFPQAMWYEIASGHAYLAQQQYGKVRRAADSTGSPAQPRTCTPTMLPFPAPLWAALRVCCCMSAGTYGCRRRLDLAQSPSLLSPIAHNPPIDYFLSPLTAPQALKRFLKVQQHFEDFQEDQFDFHGYCVRKMVSAGQRPDRPVALGWTMNGPGSDPTAAGYTPRASRAA